MNDCIDCGQPVLTAGAKRCVACYHHNQHEIVNGKQPWSLDDYCREHELDELAHHWRVGREIIIPLSPPVRHLLFGQKSIEGQHVHHVVGQTSRGRTNDERNILRVHSDTHDWLNGHTRAGRVLCCFELRAQGRLDWQYLSDLDGKRWPGIFDNRECQRCCIASDLKGRIEAMRVELVK